MDQSTYVFLSYHMKDTDRVNDLYEKLKGKGFEAFLGNQSTHEAQFIEAQLSSSDFLLVCLSQNAVAPNGKLERTMQRDLTHVWKQTNGSTFVIPLRLEECTVPASLKAFEPIDIFISGGFEQLLDTMGQVTEERRSLFQTFAANPTEQESYANIEGQTLEGPTDPSSSSDWGIDLRRLISGEREDILNRLGGVEEYIEVMLSEAEDFAAAKQAFDDALEQLVQTWQPSTLDGDFYNLHLLDLLSAHTPRGGFQKVISLVHNLKRFSKGPSEDAYSIDDDLYVKAFVALENYYASAPKPPEDQSPAYQTYLDLLREDLNSPAYGGRALKRLVELRVKELVSDELETLIRVNPQGLEFLVSLIMDLVRGSQTNEQLGLVYSLCLESGSDAERQFETAIAHCGGRLNRLETGPEIDYRGMKIGVPVPSELWPRYWGIYYQYENAKGLKNVDSMSAAG